MLDLHKNIRNSVIKSQHCQRNWDLSKEIPEQDMDLMLHAVTQCPSKQNCAFYKVTVVQDRDIIEQIHENTYGFRLLDTNEIITNSQVLANSLFIFQEIPVTERVAHKNKLDEQSMQKIISRDANIALGIASGYLNLTATMLGYSTGCCQCFDSAPIQEILNDDARVLLMMGVGYKNPDMNRRIHHADNTKQFYSIKKEPIEVKKL